MYQAGIKNITLYENKGIAFTYYEPTNLRAITALTAVGAVLTIENVQQPEFDIKIKMSDSGQITHDYIVKFFLLGLTLDNYDTINQLKKSINGWCFLVEFYDGTFKFYNVPLKCLESSISPQKEMSFELEMKNIVPTTQQYYEYTPDISTVPVYRADTTILTADTAIYTADYAL